MKLPHSYTLLLGIIVFIGIISWFIPGATHATPIDMLMAPVQGFKDGADLAFYLFIIGGLINILTKSKALDAGLSSLGNIMKGRESVLIPILMILLAFGGTTFGMCEETLAFYPVIIALMLAAGYDLIVPVSVILVGSGAGVLGSTINPFATIIASNIGNVPIGSTFIINTVTLVVSVVIAMTYTMRYASRVKAHPELSIVYHETQNTHFTKPEGVTFTPRRKLALAEFIATFIIMIWGIVTRDWYMDEMSVLFIASTLIIALTLGYKEKALIDDFIEGAEDILSVTIIIALARGISVIMAGTGITEILLDSLVTYMSHLSGWVFSVSVYFLEIAMSFLLSGTSSLAAVTMPILVPLGEGAHVGGEVVINAYQAASGVVNYVTPTSGVIVGALAIAKVPFEKWVKYVAPLMLMTIIASVVILILFSL
ncbi:hypothetical protein CI610_02546 [invertebrate metagenome]|uniref:Arginine/ornithine antiporter ArcD n=1 Tax=invertebrate metagenome TaxID=1711999 RepID=A0A2H9T5L3_9ZZZZ